MPDVFGWSPGEWEMVLRSTPWRVYWVTGFLALLLAVFTFVGIFVKGSDSTADGTKNGDASGSTVVEEVYVEASESGSAAIAQTEGKVSQQRLTAETIDQGTAIVLGDGDASVTNNTFVIVQPFDEPNLKATVYRGQLDSPDGSTADVDVMVLWKDASWYFGALGYNDHALTRFLESAEYESALSGSDAIVCIGLASHWVDKKRTTPIPSLPQSTISKTEEKTDERAFKLCQRIARHAAARDISPAFFGAGLGYHITPDNTDGGEEKQRAIVLMRVNTGGGIPPTRAQLTPLLQQVIRHPEINEFEGWKYSRVDADLPICWFQIAIGHFQAKLDNC